METIGLYASIEDANKRIDCFVSEMSGLSRSFVQGLLSRGDVLVNGGVPVKSYRLQAGDMLCVTVPPPSETEIVAQDIPLDIVFEDEHLLVVNKPKGMVVHPAAGNPDGTLVNALLYHCGESLSGIGGEIRPGIVHRIDKDTSGLLVVAKNDATHAGLSAQFSEHSIARVYNAVVYGGLKEDSGIVDAAIGRDRTDRKKMAIVQNGGRDAVTHYEVLGRYGSFTHLALRLETGRTHQIRVHMASIGHPVAGDVVYGPRKVIKALGGQCLHAKELGFVHPMTGESLFFDSPLPSYFTDFLSQL